MAFHFTPQLARFLCSARGAEWLRQVERLSLTPAGRLSDLQTLRRHLSADEAAAVLEQGLLRRRAGEKFGRAAGMLFTRPALEQATHRQVARYRAKRFAGLARVADLGCGIGGDSLRLARVAGPVWGVGRGPVRLLCARHNAAVYGLSRRVRFAQADMLALPVPLPRFNALFADPARRTTAGARVFSPRRYRPPLDALLAAFAHRPMGIKVAPGLDYAPLAAVGEVEVISLRGEAKEAALWFNALATPGVTRRATLLPGEQTLTGNAPGDCPVGPLSDFLFEPDPA
ncbi:MAG: methyltransferase domain-containing protein, partial [Anaerolineae bacterium]